MSDKAIENAQRHIDAWADTGDGYRNLGKRHILQCLWCDKYFGGRTKADALTKYREHEKEIADVAHRAYAAQFEADRARATVDRSADSSA